MWNKETDRIMWLKEHTGVVCGDMESIGAYTACNKFNVPILGIRVMSDNEILDEEYDRDTSIEAQKITLELVKKYIERIA